MVRTVFSSSEDRCLHSTSLTTHLSATTEELHHSHFYYLLLGGDHFVVSLPHFCSHNTRTVIARCCWYMCAALFAPLLFNVALFSLQGIAEYGFTAGLFLLSLLLLLHQVAARTALSTMHWDILSVVLALLPVAACVFVLLPALVAATNVTCAAEGNVCAAGSAPVSLGSLGNWLVQARITPGMCVVGAFVVGLLCTIFSTKVVAADGTSESLIDSTRTVDAPSTPKRLLVPSAALTAADSVVTPPALFSVAGKLAVHLLVMMVALGCVLAQNFSLGAALALAILPTLVTGTYSALHGGRTGWQRGLRVLVLSVLTALHSPGGLLLLDIVVTTAFQRYAYLLHQR
jgi:hypothetical protein